MAKAKKEMFQGTGRRKNAIVRVRLATGKGNITVNDKKVEEYFNLDTLLYVVKQPLELTKMTEKLDIIVRVHGGGLSGQAGAVRLGISRALVELNPDFRKVLKDEGFLTRDSRMKERKKYGLKKARKAPQFSKR